MKRRTLLGAVGIGIGTMAGCLSEATSRNPSGEPTDTSPTPTPGITADPTHVEATNDERVTIGNGTLTDDGSRKPHGIVLANSTDEARTGTLVVRRPDGSTVHDETYELESEAVVIVTVTDPLEYSATASIPGTDVSETAEMELTSFDCNRSSTTFDILAGDRIEVETVSTLVGCMNLETERVDADEEFSRSLGDGSLPDDRDRKPHDVRITNPREDTWTTRLVLERDGDLLLDGLYTLESEAAVVATLSEAGAYQGTVSVPATGDIETFEPGPFDCNDSSTIVTVQPSGELDVETITTDMACPPTESNENETTGH